MTATMTATMTSPRIKQIFDNALVITDSTIGLRLESMATQSDRSLDAAKKAVQLYRVVLPLSFRSMGRPWVPI